MQQLHRLVEILGEFVEVGAGELLGLDMLLEVGHPLLQVGGGGDADADGGVDLVGHAGNQGTEGGHLLRLHQGLLGLLEIVIGLAQLVVGIAQAAGAFRHLAFQLLVEQGDLPLHLFEGVMS